VGSGKEPGGVAGCIRWVADGNEIHKCWSVDQQEDEDSDRINGGVGLGIKASQMSNQLCSNSRKWCNPLHPYYDDAHFFCLCAVLF